MKRYEEAVKSKAQWRLVWALRNKKGKTKKDKWADSPEWTSGVNYKKLPNKKKKLKRYKPVLKKKKK